MALAPYATDADFARYLHRVLDAGGFATALGWSVPAGSYDDAVNAALALFDYDDASAATSRSTVTLLNLAGRAALWRRVVEATVHQRDTTLADGTRAEMSQIHDHARAMLALVESEMDLAGIGATAPVVQIVKLRYRHDPYAPFEEDA